MSDVASLRDEIALRQSSIADARSEREAGELTGEQLSELESRELAAIARAEARFKELEASSGEAPVRRSVRRHRRGLLIVAIVAFALAIVAAVVLALQPRQPGSSITGGINGSQDQRVTRLLSQAEIDQAVGNTVDALVAYNEALLIQSNNIEALTQSGWLYFSAGSADKDVAVIRRGEQRLAAAVRAAPSDPDPRLYYAIAAASTPGSRAVAITQFRIFVSLRPTAQLLAIARPWLLELKLARN